MALPFYVASFWLYKQKLLIVQLVCNVFFALAYFFTGSVGGCITALATLPLLVSLKIKGRYSGVISRIFYVLMIIVSIVVNLAVLKEYSSLTMIVGAAIYGAALTFVEENNTRFKVLAVIGHAFFVGFEIYIGAYLLALMDGASILSICFAGFKYRNKDLSPRASDADDSTGKAE